MADYVTPQQFGAIGDGMTDDTVAIQAAVNEAVDTGKALLVTPGIYGLTPPSSPGPGVWSFLGDPSSEIRICIMVGSNLRIIGGGGSFRLLSDPGISHAFFGTAQRFETIGAVQNVSFEDLNVEFVNFGTETIKDGSTSLFAGAGIRNLSFNNVNLSWTWPLMAEEVEATANDGEPLLILTTPPDPSWSGWGAEWIEDAETPGGKIPGGTVVQKTETVTYPPPTATEYKVWLSKPARLAVGETTVTFNINMRGRAAGLRVENCCGVRVSNASFRNIRQAMSFAYVDGLKLSNVSFEEFGEAIDLELPCTRFMFDNLAFIAGGGDEGQCMDVTGSDGTISNITFRDVGSVAFIYNKGGFPNYQDYTGPIKLKGTFNGTNRITGIVTDPGGLDAHLTTTVAPGWRVSTDIAGLIPGKIEVQTVDLDSELTLDGTTGSGTGKAFWITPQPVMNRLEGTLTEGSATITGVTPAPDEIRPFPIAPGMDVTGQGIPKGAKVLAVSEVGDPPEWQIELDTPFVTQSGAVIFFAGKLGLLTERVSLRGLKGKNGGLTIKVPKTNPAFPIPLDLGNPAIRVGHVRSNAATLGYPPETDITIDDFSNAGGSNFVVWNAKDSHFSRIAMSGTTTGADASANGAAAIMMQQSTEPNHVGICELSGSLTDVTVSASQGIGVAISTPDDFTIDRVRVEGYNLQESNDTATGIQISDLLRKPGAKLVGKLSATDGNEGPAGKPPADLFLGFVNIDPSAIAEIEGPLVGEVLAVPHLAPLALPVQLRGTENYLGNSDFSVWQRGTSFALASPLVTPVNVADLWKVCRLNGTWIVSREPGFGGALSCMRITHQAGGNPFRFGQQIEGETAQGLAGKSVFLSMWVNRPSGPPTAVLTAQLYCGTGTDDAFDLQSLSFATGTTTVVTLSSAAIVQGTPYRVEFGAASIPAGTTKLFVRHQWNVSGTGPFPANDYLEIAACELVVGTAPTASYVASDSLISLQQCLRRFQKSFPSYLQPANNVGLGTGEYRSVALTATVATQQTLGAVLLPVALRSTTPAITLYNPEGGTSGEVRDITAHVDCPTSAVANKSATLFEITCGPAAAVGNILAVHWTADAEY